MAGERNVRSVNTLATEGSAQFQNTIASIRKSLKSRANEKRGFAEVLADQLTTGFGSMAFLVVNCVWFLVWIVINLGWMPGVPAFDPFPFGLLTMVVSLEAIILAIIVLISQNRADRIADLREEVALQVEEISELEITKVLKLLVVLMEKQGIDLAGDEELRAMLQTVDTEKLTSELEKEV